MHEVKLHTLSRFAALPLFIIVLAIAMSSCSDEPTQANSPLTPLPLGNVVFHDTTVQATYGNSFVQYVAMDGGYNLVGNLGGYTAYALIEFYPSNFPARDSVTVTDAILRLHTHTRFGDSTGHFGFSVYRLNRPWDQTAITWPDIAGGSYYNTVELGTYDQSISADSQEVVIHLDTALAHDWLRTITGTDSTTKDGIILVPTTNTTIVRGFNSFGSDSAYLNPQVVITSTQDGVTYVDTVSNGIDTFVGNIDHLASDPTLLYLQSGVTYRSRLLFDVSFIPRGAFVNSAQVTLQRAPGTQIINRYSVDSVEAHLLLSNVDSTQIESVPFTYGNYAAGSPDVITFDARHLVQYWVRGPNDGVLLMNDRVSEVSSMDRHTFYSPLADSTRRPRLRVLYSLAKR